MLRYKSTYVGLSTLKLVRNNFCSRILNAHKQFDPVTPQSTYANFIPGTNKEYDLPNSFPVNVWNDFITTEEEDKLVQFLDPTLQKKEYSKSHFDSVICNYKEHLLSHTIINQNEFLSNIFQRVKDKICAEGIELEFVHVLDIAEDGFIAPHVDTDFTGGIVAGLTLLSDAVITFQPHNPDLQESLLEEKKNSNNDAIKNNTKLALNETIVFPDLPRVELLVPKRSLYIITKEARYDWTHAIELQQNHKFKNELIERKRRISLMFRDLIPFIPSNKLKF